jgi:hypothetical protein
MFEHKPRLPIDNLFHNEMTEIDTDLNTYLANHQKRMTEALKTANENIHRKASDRYSRHFAFLSGINVLNLSCIVLLNLSVWAFPSSLYGVVRDFCMSYILQSWQIKNINARQESEMARVSARTNIHVQCNTAFFDWIYSIFFYAWAWDNTSDWQSFLPSANWIPYTLSLKRWTTL